MRKLILANLLFALFILLQSRDVFPWDNEVTHKDLSEYAAKSSILSSNKGDYLKNLGFNLRLDEVLAWQGKNWTATKWFREGADLEDAGTNMEMVCGTARSYNHFHNPLKPWGSAGLDDYVVNFCPPFILIPPHMHATGESSLLWAQNGTLQQNFTKGDWSWQKARGLFYSALTSTTDSERQADFAQTFRGLGHQMHLLQDAGQPDHVRNDAHPVDGSGAAMGLETWTKGNADILTCLLKQHNSLPPETLSKCEKYGINESVNIENYYPTISTDPSVYSLDPSYYSKNLTPAALFIDTDQYNGITPSTSLSQGLAEYTNSNFVSDDTIFTEALPTDDRHYFPYPRKTSTNIQELQNQTLLPVTIVSQGGVAEKSFYIKKNADGEIIEHFVKPKYFTNNVYSVAGGGGYLYNRTFYRDEICHQDYVEKLIPRAVGYSAGLLNYFFRGKLGITQVSGGIKVKNLGTETMSSYVDQATQTTVGTIQVFYDDTSGNRTFLSKYDLTTPIAPGAETDIIYFAAPTSNLSPKRYIVVFRGKLGNEEGAVIGKVALPPHVYYVATTSGWDKIYKIDADGTNQSIVYDNPDGDYIGRIAQSPDGNKLAFVSSPDGLIVNSTIQILNLTDTGLTPTVLTSGNWPSWSPDGSKIVLERDISQDPYAADIEIFTVDVATGVETQLTNIAGSSYSGSPAWSPAGNSIAYSKFVGSQTGCATNYVISLMDTAGYPIGPLTCPPEGQYMSVGDFDPAWSPDGQQIAFTRRRYVGRSSQLNKVDITAKTITKLTDSPDVGYDEYTPAWFFDEMSIAIGSKRDGDYDIWLVDPYGAGYQQNLTNSNPEIDGYPAFGQ